MMFWRVLAPLQDHLHLVRHREMLLAHDIRIQDPRGQVLVPHRRRYAVQERRQLGGNFMLLLGESVPPRRRQCRHLDMYTSLFQKTRLGFGADSRLPNLRSTRGDHTRAVRIREQLARLQPPVP